MAEVVERNVEDSLPEIVHIRRAKLFNEAELREVVRLRRHHEYSIQKRNKRLSDYESYIAAELGILRLVIIRRQKTMDFRFKDEIERSIITRLVRLHRQTCYRFQSHIDVWMRFLLFNRKLGRHMAVTRLWERILQVHGRTDPRLWAAAASFHLNEGARAQARAILAKLKTERHALTMAIKKVKRLRKSPTCAQEGVALRLETLHLHKLLESINRSVHLAWDRTHLRGLREARRLLTQGLAFNENSVFLLLELLKLEGLAADFFKKRVANRHQMAKDELEGEASASRKIMGRYRNMRKAKESEREDAVAFMNEVTEDVDSVKSGETFNLVLERFSAFSSANSNDLADALEIAKKFSSFTDKAIMRKLSNRQKELLTSEATKVKMGQTITERAHATAPLTEDIAASAVQRHSELMRLLDAEGVEAALESWDTWYHAPGGSNDLLRVADPSADPWWMRLLTARIYILVVARMLYKSTQPTNTATTSKEDVTEVVRAYQEFRLKQEAHVRKTRALMDTLAASNWGSKVPEFWHLYMEFEAKLGDCSRLPSLRWRAEKCLEEGPRVKFFAVLTAGGPKEFLGSEIVVVETARSLRLVVF
ncbi:U3 small nucleolar RNA-associated protein [Echinococcus granulosus]|uniref:U3 small nucleolar RNA-associated protein n=2 Tax=Echinococcus granulosus TaxID=6210 RepID=W6VCQ9_ECHGR|nr:U3 small nucleolar RNA-associated protein [Echinococcus granulosus]EUB64694.1 U3 small nucleolar RNA-associated protein [Echinococcus granulosus]